MKTMKSKTTGFIAVFFLISCIPAFAGGEQDSSPGSSSYEFEQEYQDFGFLNGIMIIYYGYLSLLDREIPNTALAVLSKEELRLLRNAIYAKHGMIFQSNDLTTHFQQYSWYRPRSRNVETQLTEVDRINIGNIQVFENAQPNRNLRKNQLVGEYVNFFPVPSGSGHLHINDNNTIEINEWPIDGSTYKGTYTIENGFLIVLIAGYETPIKLVFPVSDEISERGGPSRRMIGYTTWYK
jgi:hypothetical protein